MDLKTIQQLLLKAHPILQKSKAEKKEREAKGEYFSIFEYLNFSRFEEQLHTPFLRMLLDKDANHGVGKGFLEAFLKMVVKNLKSDFQYDINSSHVEYQDVYLGCKEISENGTSTGGKIDILLHDDKKHAIIIENKFDRNGNPAQDQPKQLERYYNYGKDDKKYEDFILIYLTPSGQYASENSTGPNKITYYRMSYDLSDDKDKPNILSWLDECLNISKGCPRIHEVIKQYITYIKNTRQIMEGKYQNELWNLLFSDENLLDVTLNFIHDGEKIKEKIRRNFCDKLVQKAGEYGLELREQYDNNFITWNKDNIWMYFVGKKKCQSQVGFVVGYFSRTDDNNGGMLYGLSIINGDYSNLEELKHKFKIESGNPDDEYPEFTQENSQSKLSEEQWKEFPWGFSYLTDENRKCDKNWYDWDDPQTLADMHNGKMLKFMETRFEILKKNGIIDKL